MKPDSLSFTKELQNLPKYKEFERKIASSMTHTSKSMMTHVFSRMRECERIWNEQKSSIMESLRILDFSAIEKETANEFSWIPEEIRDSIRTKCNKHLSVLMSFSEKDIDTERTFQIFFCVASTADEHEIHAKIRKVHRWLCFVNKYVDASCSKTVNVFLYLIDDKKEMPHEHEVIDRLHVNTAFTTTCQPHTNVHIFREEEWYRVLIHESFHNLGLDFIRMGDTAIAKEENAIKTVIPVPIPDIRLYETYCEMWAEILNVAFHVWTTCKSKKMDVLLRKFHETMRLEQAFAVWQCVKVLDHNDIKYAKLSQDAPNYKENTQSFAYYVLKSILSVHLNRFLDFCYTQHRMVDEKTRKRKAMHNKTVRSKSRKVSISFLKTDANLTKYRRLFTDHYDSSKMKYATNYMQSFLEKKMGTPFFKTLRMSLIESN